MNESYLNSAIFAFEAGHVVDWVEFLSREWSIAAFHDKFPVFVNYLREEMKSDQGAQFFVDSVIDVMETTQEFSVIAGERRRMVGDRGAYIPDGTRQAIETHTLEFIKKNRSLLTRFHIPKAAPRKSFTGSTVPNFEQINAKWIFVEVVGINALHNKYYNI